MPGPIPVRAECLTGVQSPIEFLAGGLGRPLDGRLADAEPSQADDQPGPVRGSSGSSGWSRGSPFFASRQGDLERLGTDSVDAVADLEFGVPEQLVVGPRR